MKITQEMLMSWEFENLTECQFLIRKELDRRRIESYPDDFTRIVQEGVMGYDREPLHKLIDEYSKIVGEYSRYRHVESVNESYGENNEDILFVEYKDYDGDYSSLNVPLSELKDLDVTREKIKQKEELQRKHEIARLESEIERLKLAIEQKKSQ